MRQRPAIEVYEATLHDLLNENIRSGAAWAKELVANQSELDPSASVWGKVQSSISSLWNGVLFGTQSIQENPTSTESSQDRSIEWALAAGLSTLLISPATGRDHPTTLANAIEAYRQAKLLGLEYIDGKKWGQVQLVLGNELLHAARLHRDVGFLERATSIIQPADQYHRTNQDLFLSTQILLGNTYLMLGTHYGKESLVDDATRVLFKAAQKTNLLKTPSRAILGRSLVDLGKYRKSVEPLVSAVEILRNALKSELPTREGREYFPYFLIQHDLAEALVSLGEQERNLARIDEGIALYRELAQVDKSAILADEDRIFFPKDFIRRSANAKLLEAEQRRNRVNR